MLLQCTISIQINLKWNVTHNWLPMECIYHATYQLFLQLMKIIIIETYHYLLWFSIELIKIISFEISVTPIEEVYQLIPNPCNFFLWYPIELKKVTIFFIRHCIVWIAQINFAQLISIQVTLPSARTTVCHSYLELSTDGQRIPAGKWYSLLTG